MKVFSSLVLQLALQLVVPQTSSTAAAAEAEVAEVTSAPGSHSFAAAAAAIEELTPGHHAEDESKAIKKLMFMSVGLLAIAPTLALGTHPLDENDEAGHPQLQSSRRRLRGQSQSVGRFHDPRTVNVKDVLGFQTAQAPSIMDGDSSAGTPDIAIILDAGKLQDVAVLEEQPITWSAPPKITENIECGSSLSKVPLYVIDDACSLGHMQMSFVHLFHWLLTTSSSGRIGYTLYKLQCGELQPVRDLYYDPMLLDIIKYAKSELNFELVLLEEDLDHVVACENTVLSNHMIEISHRDCLGDTDLEIWGNSCRAWFPSGNTVRQWHSFLKVTVLSDMMPSSIEKSGMQVLVLDRAKGYKRSFRDPQKVVDVVSSSCEQCHVEYYQFTGRREDAKPWAWNCHFFAKFDIIVMAHGAAVSNAVCVKPGSGLVEVGQGPQEAKPSMYMTLMNQLNIHYFHVPYASGGQESVVSPNLTILADAVQSLLAKVQRQQKTLLHHHH